MTDESEELSPVWRWPVEWVTSKKFWENVAANVVAGWIIALVGLVIVGLSGLLPSKNAYVTAAWFTTLTLAPISFVIAGSSFGTWVSAMTFRFHGFRGPENEKLKMVAFVGPISAVICILTVVGAFMNWPKNVGAYLWEHLQQGIPTPSPTT